MSWHNQSSLPLSLLGLSKARCAPSDLSGKNAVPLTNVSFEALEAVARGFLIAPHNQGEEQ